MAARSSAREAVVGHELVDAGAVARLGLAHEEDGEAAPGHREVEGEVHRRRRPPDLGEHVGLDQRVLPGGRRAGRRGCGTAPRRRCGSPSRRASTWCGLTYAASGVPKVRTCTVGKCAASRKLSASCSALTVVWRGAVSARVNDGIVPLGELVQVAHRVLGREPHEAEALAHRVRGVEARTRREHRVGSERGDGGGASVGARTATRGSRTRARRRRRVRRSAARSGAGSGRGTRAPRRRGARAPTARRAATPAAGGRPARSTRATACQPRASAGETLSSTALSMARHRSRSSPTPRRPLRPAVSSHDRNALAR